ncbi:MAG TPA: hypothetical protein VLF21_01715 [Candidatus Saccharimonadales bacterium]|nr:hypothetical protein [Candidatus Saccharimonadales bacterium]
MVRNDERGLVSLLTVSIICLLIMVITLSMAKLMVGELRQATDSEDSIKAYYTAQGAAEDKAQQIRSQIASGVAPNSLNTGCTAGATTIIKCVKVSTSMNEVSTELDADKDTRVYDLTNTVTTQSDNLTRLLITWDDKAAQSPLPDSFTDPGNCISSSGCSWYTGAIPTSGQPPVIEVAVTNYFPGQNTNIDTANSRTIILNPRCLGGGASCNPPSPDPQLADYNSYKPTGGSSPIVQVACRGKSPNRCALNLSNITPSAGYRTVVFLRAHFHNAKLTMRAFSTNIASLSCKTDANYPGECNNPIALDQAQIDVTASIGATFRRTVLQVPIRSTPATPGLVLEGDSDICKNFDLLTANGHSQISINRTIPCLIDN